MKNTGKYPSPSAVSRTRKLLRLFDGGIVGFGLGKHAPTHVGHIAGGMHGKTSISNAVRRPRLASDFYTTGMEHSPTSATGTAWERTPWHATPRAAWGALKKAETMP
jgi:hypothetical protein